MRTASATLKSTTTSAPRSRRAHATSPTIVSPSIALADVTRIDGGDQFEVRSAAPPRGTPPGPSGRRLRRHRPCALAKPYRPANDATWSSKAPSSKGPTALSVRGASTSSCAWASTSSRPTASTRARTSSIGLHLAVQQHGGPDAAHAGPRVLAREQHLGPEVALGHRQLAVGDPVLGQQLELTGHDAQHLVDVVGSRADDDGQRTGILVGGPLGPHRVGQPALFADLLEEPAREPAAQDVVEHGQRPSPLVETGDRPHPVDDVGLLGRAPDHMQPLGLRPGCGARRGRSPGLAGEASFEVGRHALVGAVAGHRDHHVARAVVVREEAAYVLRAECTHGRLGAERVAPERVAGEQRGLPLLGHQVRRLVGVHQDLVEDHGALGVDVGRAQRGVPHDLAQDVEPERQVLGEQADVEGRVLLGGERVAVAAHLVERLGDGGGRTASACP